MIKKKKKKDRFASVYTILIRSQIHGNVQWRPAQYTSTTITVSSGEYEFQSQRNVILRLTGYTRAMQTVVKKGEDQHFAWLCWRGVFTLNETVSWAAILTKPGHRPVKQVFGKRVRENVVLVPSSQRTHLHFHDSRSWFMFALKSSVLCRKTWWYCHWAFGWSFGLRNEF